MDRFNLSHHQVTKTPRNTKVKKSSFCKYFLRLLFTVTILGYVLWNADLGALWIYLRAANIGLLLVAVLLYFPGQLLAAYRWSFILQRLGRPLPFWSLFRHNVRGQLSALFLPGQISGDIVRVFSVSRKQTGKFSLALSILIDKLAFLIAVAAFAFSGILAAGPVIQLIPVYLLTFLVMLVSGLALLVLGRYRSQKTPALLARLVERFPAGKRYLASLDDWLRQPSISYFSIFKMILLALAFQCLNAVGSYAIARGMQISIDLYNWAAINAIVAIVQILPLTIAGLGVREGLFASLLARYFVPSEQAIAHSLTGFALISILVVINWLVLEWLFRPNKDQQVNPMLFQSNHQDTKSLSSQE